ncbi:uncharacterized protein K452DRAFT_320584 [Aplosporella prunicola CBS 121167]|uniref:FAD-binding domain-containing protein n=1 Tax=Aplosporella prunicola CBS 121167 TaxID=1176127 RepID=A0A6A6B7G3_9PEZI|nr:uncharacterized protein K452DRAFT_320584 [Aplosporella prunicola CBS 121167]KAF2138917.1 hypothetical protein K452DRAFT_320584 [Aplosporella prunicola CBS 121167]
MASKNFRVIIAGGSIAGLALANMLERLDIDYVVLEAYPEISPQVGASIALLPNSLRVLDQLGCYPALRALIENPTSHAHVRNPDGKELLKLSGLSDHLIKRHGYPLIFCDRRMVIQALYDNLKDKSKIKVGKRVAEVLQVEGEVKVRTGDDETVVGDILVGADGIHSNVRKEMWRIANSMEPGYIPTSEESAMPCDYKCIFGISMMKGFPADNTHTILGKHTSYLVFSGPGDRVYWFYFENIGGTRYGKDIPRYSKKDEEELVKKHLDDPIIDELKFRDLYNTRIISILTDLPEYSFKKWHFKRIVTIGDSAHKFQPISGQGGNNAVETAAAVVNGLVNGMKNNPGGLSDAEIHSIFSHAQELRQDRVWSLIRASHAQQRLEAMETPLLGLMATYLVPRLHLESIIDRFVTGSVPATRLTVLPMRKFPHFVPYEDELPSEPLGCTWLSRSTVVAALGTVLYIAQQALKISSDLDSMSFAGSPVKQYYTGFEKLDSLLSLLVAVFSEGVAGTDPNVRLQCTYFMAMIMPAALIWTIEAYRIGNIYSLVSWPVIFSVASQLLGIGKVAPLYFLASVYTTSTPIYTRTTGRPLPSSVAKAITPALCLGYVIPTVLMFTPIADTSLWQTMVAAWQPYPVYVALLTYVIAWAVRRIEGHPPLETEMYAQKDLTPLQVSYGFAFFATATVHICTFFHIYATPGVSLASVFANLPNPFGPSVAALTSTSEALSLFFKFDLLLYVAAVMIWCLYSVYELRRLGYVLTGQATKAALAVLAGQVLVGPAATYVGLWSWRENVIAGQVRE